MKKIELGILGAGRHIGKSCHALRLGNILLLIDAGMDPSVEFTPQNAGIFLPLFIGKDGQIGLADMMRGIDAVFLVITHAHHDHSGGVIPVVDFIENHFPRVSVHIIMTPPTWRFCELTWMESARSMTRRKSWLEAKPLFNEFDILRMKQDVRLCETGEKISLSDSIDIMLVPAGHILGAVSVLVSAWGAPVFFTGDISFDDHYLVPGAVSFTIPELKGLICDGTYIGERGENREIAESRCARGAIDVMNRGGVALYPAFQIDRAPEIIEILIAAGVPLSKIYLDGGARIMSKVYKDFLGKDWTSCFVKSKHHRIEILERNESCVVVASGGMLKGASLEWAKGITDRQESAIFLNGWADPCSPASQLLEMMKLDDDGSQKELRVVDDEGNEHRYPVKCGIDFFNLSGHAHGGQLEQYWREMNPEHLVLIHTEGDRTEKYLRKHRSRVSASHVHLPHNGELIEF